MAGGDENGTGCADEQSARRLLSPCPPAKTMAGTKTGRAVQTRSGGPSSLGFRDTAGEGGGASPGEPY
jgi:hypothetical protein